MMKIKKEEEAITRSKSYAQHVGSWQQEGN
jgi:hypothetical protein